MSVYCSKCGEELLGAVNRCWKCGTPFVAPPVSADVPPVRRAPVSLAVGAPGEASAMAAEIVGTSSSTRSANGQPGAVVAASGAVAPTRRRGSPFADSHHAAQGPAPASVIQPARPYRAPVDYARPSAATGGAVASLILGILSLCGSYYIPIGALVAALLGIGMGLWGLYSERRGLAIAGLLLCCVTLAVAGFFGAIDLYTLINGRRPWEPDPALETGPLTDF